MDFTFPKIGIIGLGYVGQTIFNCYNDLSFRIVCIDIDPDKSNGTYSDLIDCEVIFVCVPSPSKSNGECDTSILNSVLYQLKEFKNLIISKTTATPQYYEKMQFAYPNLVHVPEFLRAETATRDFTTQKKAIIGGSVLAYQREAERLLRLVQPLETVTYCKIGEAALTKYVVNSFLATKVVFMNEMAELANAHNYDWNQIRYLIQHDSRLGDSHDQVPGRDGQYGFGGMCFPKDTESLLKNASKLGVDLNVLKSAVKKNTILRLQKPK